MRKILCLLLCVVLILPGCGKTEQAKGLQIVAVSFPGYSFAKEIAGDKAEVTLLLPLGSEAHSYEPTPKDIIKIQSCDLFIYGGGDSEVWVEEILSSADKEIKTVKMTDCVDLLSPDGHDEKDVHVWTSPQNAIKIAQAIGKALSEADGENKEIYQQNTKAYVQKLSDLDKQYAEYFEKCENPAIVVGDRFPFLYLAKAYGIDYRSAYPSCAGESEPSAAVVAELQTLVKEQNIPVVFYTEFSNQKVAKTICEGSSAKPLMLHSCHNVSQADFETGASYVSLMEQNLANLKEAVPCK